MENYYLQIESYLLGELNEHELLAFEEALQNDPELVLAVDRIRDIQKRLAALKLRNQVSAVLKNQERSKNPGNRLKTFFIIAVALVLILITVIWQFKVKKRNLAKEATTPIQIATPPTNPDSINKNELVPAGIDTIALRNPDIAMNDRSEKILVSEFYIPVNIDYLRSVESSNSPKTILQQADEAFKQKKYSKAATLLQDEKKYESEDLGIFIRAHSYFKLGQYQAAANDFKRLINSFQFKNEARWSFLLCNIAQGKTLKDPETKVLLDSMISARVFPFQQKAIALKSRLE
ncbi:MAG: hypothetical protein ABI761_17710 [Saprospiraceae bacterium]